MVFVFERVEMTMHWAQPACLEDVLSGFSGMTIVLLVLVDKERDVQ